MKPTAMKLAKLKIEHMIKASKSKEDIKDKYPPEL